MKSELQLPNDLCQFWRPDCKDNLVASLKPSDSGSEFKAKLPVWLQASSEKEIISFRIDLRFAGGVKRAHINAGYIIGRKRNKADIVVEHSSLSKAHAMVGYNSGCKAFLWDFESKNGTYVNGKRIKPFAPYFLTNGDIIRFGSYPVDFELVCHEEKFQEEEKAPSETKESKQAQIARITAEMVKGPVNYNPRTVENDSANENEKGAALGFPVTECAEFGSEHTKAICSLAINSSGSRFVTGSYDYKVKIWDFGGMTRNLLSFKELLPEDGHIVSALSYSPTGAYFLAIPESPKARVFTREGVEEVVTTRGDPYIHDQLKTKGHVSTITCGKWNPVDKNTFLTSAVDGTCRIWDINGPTTLLDSELICRAVLKAKDKRNARIKISSCSYDFNGERIGCACTDGSIQIWNPRSGYSYGQPDLIIRSAHIEGGHISSICFNQDGRYLLTRGGDDTLQLWDVRKPKGPAKRLLHAKGLENTWPQCNAVFSPDGAHILTGTSTRKGGKGTGDLCFWKVLDANEDPMHRIPLVKGSSVICVSWHPKLNQIFAGSEDGKLRLFYDSEKSTKGILQALGRVSRKKRDFYANIDSTNVYEGDIYVPNALPMFREEQEKMFIRKKYKQTIRDEMRKDPTLSKRPEPPPEQIQANINQEINQMQVANKYMDGIAVPVSNYEQQDPRKELFKYTPSSESKKERATWVENSYKMNEPKKVLAERTMEEEEEIIEKARTSLQDYQARAAEDAETK